MNAPSAHPGVPSAPPESFVGRERELAGLRGALDRALAGSGCIHTVSGEPGIGKTRLAEEFAACASAAGARVLKGRSFEAGGVPSYWPWLQAIRPLLESSTQKQLASDWGSSADVAATIVPELAKRLPGLKPYRSAVLSAEDARLRILDAFTAYLGRVSRRQPLLLVLDDLQWADQDSLQLLLYLAHELAESPTMVLAIHRQTGLEAQHPLLKVLGELVKERLYREHRLEGLSEAEVERYVTGVLGDGVSPDFGKTIHQLTAGNPLYMSQLAREPIALAGLADRLPPGVRGAIANRLATLTRHTREVLEAACLFAGDFAVETLAAVLGEPVAAVLGAMDEAARAAILRQAPERIGHYDFVHVLIREVLSVEMPLEERTRLHARIGEALESLYGAQAESHAAEIAVHFAAAKSLAGAQKPARYALAAARQALERQSWEEALRQVASGLEAL